MCLILALQFESIIWCNMVSYGLVYQHNEPLSCPADKAWLNIHSDP